MAIKFNCPRCAKEMSVKDELAGKQGKCPFCKNLITVPGAPPAKNRPPAAAPPVRKKPVEEEVEEAEVVEEAEEVEEAEVVEAEVVDEKPRKKGDRDRRSDEAPVARAISEAPVARVVDDVPVARPVDDDDRPRRRRRDDDDEDDDRDRRRRRDEDDDDDDRPRKRKRDDDDDDRDRKRRRDDDDDRDRKRRRDDDDDRPRRKSRNLDVSKAKRREREEEEYGKDDDDLDEKERKAKYRGRRQAWERASFGLYLNFLGTSIYAGVAGMLMLLWIVALFVLIIGSGGSPTLARFAEIFMYLLYLGLLANWVLNVVGSAFLVMTPGRHGAMGLGIATLSLSAFVFLTFFMLTFGSLSGIGFTGQIAVSVLIFVGTMVAGPVELPIPIHVGGGIGAMAVLLPLMEIARLSVFGFYQWSVARNCKDPATESAGWLIGILAPAGLFGLWLVNTLVFSVMAKVQMPPIVGWFIIFLELSGLGSLLLYYSMVVSTTSRIAEDGPVRY